LQNYSVKKMEDKDYFQVLNIWSGSYQFSVSNEMLKEPKELNIIVLKDESERILSCADFVTTRVIFCDREIEVVKIYRVATLLSERRKGYSKRLIIDSLRNERSNGRAIAWLKTKSDEIYSGIGFVSGLVCSKARINISDLVSIKPQGKILQLEPWLIGSIQNICEGLESTYSAFAKTYNFMAIREKEYWEKLINNKNFFKYQKFYENLAK